MKTLLFIALSATLALGNDVPDDLKAQPRTREEINSNIDREANGVYFLNEANFDDFINYNDLVLICFFETGEL